jgi:hypothetical protein
MSTDLNYYGLPFCSCCKGSGTHIIYFKAGEFGDNDPEGPGTQTDHCRCVSGLWYHLTQNLGWPEDKAEKLIDLLLAFSKANIDQTTGTMFGIPDLEHEQYLTELQKACDELQQHMKETGAPAWQDDRGNTRK